MLNLSMGQFFSNQVVHLLTTIFINGYEIIISFRLLKTDFFSLSLLCFRKIQLTKAFGNKRNT